MLVVRANNCDFVYRGDVRLRRDERGAIIVVSDYHLARTIDVFFELEVEGIWGVPYVPRDPEDVLGTF